MNNDLISRSTLIKWIDDSVSQYGHTYSTDMLNMWGLFKDYLINNAPTVENRPTGEWIVVSREDCNTFLNPIYKCPFCGEVYAVKKPYCTCGAKMKKEAENEQTTN